jgi:hypothetical protein
VPTCTLGGRSNVALARALEEEAHDKDLQGAHADNQARLDKAKVDNALLCAADGAEVTVLAGAEVLLVAGNRRKLAGYLEGRLGQRAGLLVGAALLGWEGDAGLVLDLRCVALARVCGWLGIDSTGGIC